MKFGNIAFAALVVGFVAAGCVTASDDWYAEYRKAPPILPNYSMQSEPFKSAAVCTVKNAKETENVSEYLQEQLKKRGLTIVPYRGIDSIFVPKIDYVIKIVWMSHSDMRIENGKFVGYPRLFVSVRRTGQGNDDASNIKPRYFQAASRFELSYYEHIAWTMPSIYESYRKAGYNGCEKTTDELYFTLNSAVEYFRIAA